MKKITKNTASESIRYCFRQTTTMEKLTLRLNASDGAVLKFGDKVLLADYYRHGYVAAVYEFVEAPAETDLGACECRLNLIEKADALFEDGGHAIQWAISKAM